MSGTSIVSARARQYVSHYLFTATRAHRDGVGFWMTYNPTNTGADEGWRDTDRISIIMARARKVITPGHSYIVERYCSVQTQPDWPDIGVRYADRNEAGLDCTEARRAFKAYVLML